MNITATVNYHIQNDTPQAYYIDADGVDGKLLSPEQVQVEVMVNDVRDSEVNVEFFTDSLEFVHHTSAITNFEKSINAWKTLYNQELTTLLMNQLNVHEVVIFDHTLRIDDPNSNRKPARNVHSDYSECGAQHRLIDILGEETARDWATGHYGFINIWRPVTHPITSAPLGFVRPDSVKPNDWVTLDLIYPDRQGQIMGLAANPEHEWLYLSNMTPNEVAIFNIYDNKGLRSIGHSALDLTTNNAPTIRKSLESRTLVRY